MTRASKVAWVLMGAAAAVFAVALALVDPVSAIWMPKCPLFMLTGVKCPSCGSSRAIHELFHGNIVEGLAYNPFIVISFPLAAFILWVYFAKPKRISQRCVAPLAIVFVVLCIVWMIVRNIWGL